MPIPFIIAVMGATAAAAAVNHYGQEVNNDYADELNRINDEMRTLCEDTNTLISQYEEELKQKNNLLNDLKGKIIKSTLTEFSRTYRKIKKIDKVELSKSFEEKEMFFEFESSMLKYQDNSVHGGKGEAGAFIATSNNFVKTCVKGSNPVGIFLSAFAKGAFKGVQLIEKIEDAKKEHAKLEEQCEEVNVKLTALSNTYSDSYDTILELKKITDKLIREVENILYCSGCNYAHYNAKEKNRVMLMIDSAIVLDKLVFTDMFDTEGSISYSFYELIEDAKKLVVAR